MTVITSTNSIVYRGNHDIAHTATRHSFLKEMTPYFLHQGGSKLATICFFYTLRSQQGSGSLGSHTRTDSALEQKGSSAPQQGLRWSGTLPATPTMLQSTQRRSDDAQTRLPRCLVARSIQFALGQRITALLQLYTVQKNLPQHHSIGKLLRTRVVCPEFRAPLR